MTDYSEAVEVMDGLVEKRERGYVCAAPVHALVVAQDDPELLGALRRSTLVVPDGMPLVWAANLLGERLEDRVYGPELMLRYSARCAERGHRVWLYGGRDQVSLDQLALGLRRRLPDLKIVGGHSPPFRPLERRGGGRAGRADQRGRARRAVGRHRRAQAGEVDGPDARAPRGAGDVRRRARPSTSTPGNVSMAPRWMQDRGLEWLYRPRRSRAGSCPATSAPTRASWSRSHASI